MLQWIKNRFLERTTWDGILLIATGVVSVILPTTLVGSAATSYGAFTIPNSE